MEYSEIQHEVDGLFDFAHEPPAVSLKSALASHALGRVDNVYMCCIEDILVLENFNPRADSPALKAHIRSIADSIRQEGYYADEPISVFAGLRGKKNVFYVTDGHCRLRAVKLANEEGAHILDVPISIKNKATSFEDLTVAFVRANEGKKLEPLELAVCCKRLLGYNWTIEKIAQKIGFSTEYVSQLLMLAGAPSAVRAMVACGQVPAAVALNAIRTHGCDAVQVLTDALHAAQAKGKARLTNRFMPEQVRRVALRKAAPKMLEIIQQIHGHPSYKGLASDLKQLVEDVLSSMAPNSSATSAPGTFEKVQPNPVH